MGGVFQGHTLQAGARAADSPIKGTVLERVTGHCVPAEISCTLPLGHMKAAMEKLWHDKSPPLSSQ